MFKVSIMLKYFLLPFFFGLSILCISFIHAESRVRRGRNASHLNNIIIIIKQIKNLSSVIYFSKFISFSSVLSVPSYLKWKPLLLTPPTLYYIFYKRHSSYSFFYTWKIQPLSFGLFAINFCF